MNFRFAARVCAASAKYSWPRVNQANLEELVVADNESNCHSCYSPTIKRRSRRAWRVAHARM